MEETSIRRAGRSPLESDIDTTEVDVKRRVGRPLRRQNWGIHTDINGKSVYNLANNAVVWYFGILWKDPL